MNQIHPLYDRLKNRFLFVLLCASAVLCIVIACSESPRLIAISITPENAKISIDGTQQFTAIGTFPNGSTKDITSLVHWHSSNDIIATISKTGLATGLADGTTQITADLSGTVSNKATLNVILQIFYVADFGNNRIVVFNQTQLTTSNSPPPMLIISGPSISQPSDLTFDADGNLWVLNDGDGSIVQMTAAQLAACPTNCQPQANMTITSPDIHSPTLSFVFDASGNLWISNEIQNTIVELTSDDINACGMSCTLSAAITIQDGSLNYPFGLAFDIEGNLWVANNTNGSPPQSVVQYTPQQLAIGGVISANKTINYAQSVPGPTGLAFDEMGNLWVSNGGGPAPNGTAISQFTKTQLDSCIGVCSLNPNVLLSSFMNTTINGPGNLTFDVFGNLWVTNAFYPTLDAGTLIEFTSADLLTSGSPPPNVTITDDFYLPLAVTIYPQ